MQRENPPILGIPPGHLGIEIGSPRAGSCEGRKGTSFGRCVERSLDGQTMVNIRNVEIFNLPSLFKQFILIFGFSMLKVFVGNNLLPIVSISAEQHRIDQIEIQLYP